MNRKIFIHVALSEDLKRRQLDPPQYLSGQRVAEKVPGMFFVRKHGMEEPVVGGVDGGHTPYNG